MRTGQVRVAVVNGYSPQDIKLTAVNGSLTNANNDLLINILGRNVGLVALNGSIGYPTNSLNVGVNIDGTSAALTVDAPAGFWRRTT